MRWSWWWLIASALLPFVATLDKHDLVPLEQPLLLVSTLNGSLVGINKNTGEVLWRLTEDPVLDVPVDSTYGPRFLPNPRDGSLYSFGGIGDQLERLPLTIPELVHVSPTISSDGLLYTGRKTDMWLAVDPMTGTKLHTFSSDGVVSSTCPIPDFKERAIYIGRTTYTVTVHDSHSKERRWNATYVEYSSHSFNDHNPQDLLHFTSNSDGTVLAMDPLTGQRVWQHSYGSPVIAIYSVEGGNMRKLPMTTVASHTLHLLTGSSVLAIRADTPGIKATDTVLQSSLFVGASGGQVYALESLAEEEDVKFEYSPLQSSVIPLLEGPGDLTDPIMDEEDPPEIDTSIQVSDFGHFCLPSESEVQFTPLSKQIHQEFLSILQKTYMYTPETATTTPAINYSPTASPDDPDLPTPAVEYNLSAIGVPIATVFASSLVAALIAIVVTRINNRQQAATPSSMSGHSSLRSHSLSGSTHDDPQSNHSNASTGDSSSKTKSQTGEFAVGKILFSTHNVIGHGSQGTTVFRGTFDKRPVAVKRILPECFDLADREYVSGEPGKTSIGNKANYIIAYITQVDLLRQSDQHPHVVRYFCMEQDHVFRYIALELCQATLHEYVEDWRFDQSQVDGMSILHQAVKGLNHLHSMGIVHRDIKPRNVLLSFPTSNGGVRAMISDFGLCRKLPQGKVSFTAKSGVTGTEGWIAPEMLHGTSRVTFSVDIFSMGCVIYYVLTRGVHPFGPSLRRQANIEAGDSVLSALTGTRRGAAQELIKTMISHNYVFRPTSGEVVSHCLFWSREKQLAFFQDVSDRIEKEPTNSAIMQALEQGSLHVVKGDWRNNISIELRDDLRKFRSYQGGSVRDLLRAMRNKKHHYRELPEDVKQSLGQIPDGFVEYFTSRFPLLLIHTYKQMEICKHERIFQPYFSSDS